MSDDESVGARIRRYRRSRGLSLDQAAGLTGISKGYLSRLERGERSVDSRSLLNRIAGILDVSLSDLTGQPYTPHDRDHAQAHRGVQRVRLALLDPSGPSRPVSEVAAVVDDLPAVMDSCDLVGQARLVPDLLRWTQQHAWTAPSVEAFRRVAIASYVAVFLMRNLGEFDLAWMAVERMRAAAEQADDPTMSAFAAYAQAHALTGAGALNRAALVAAGGVSGSSDADVSAVAARGSCLLVSASTNAALGRPDLARAQLDEAAELAELVTVPNLITAHTSFTAWNVIMHRVSVEVESGDPAAAVLAARPLLKSPVRHRERMSYLWVDVGRAMSQMDRHREAIEAFRRAERSAPLRVRLNPVVRDTMRTLLDRGHRNAGGADLRALAERCGVFGDM